MAEPPPQPVYARSFDMAESAFENEKMIQAHPTPVFSSDQDVSTTANVNFLIGSN